MLALIKFSILAVTILVVFISTLLVIELIFLNNYERRTFQVSWLTNDENWIADYDLIFYDQNVITEIEKKMDTVSSCIDCLVIATIGDSFTNGNGVSRDKSFPALLEDYLNRNGHKVVVINLGIGGYSPDQAIALFDKYYNRGLKVDYFIWTLYAGNDLLETIGQDIYHVEDYTIKKNTHANYFYFRQIILDLIPFSEYIINTIINYLLVTLDPPLVLAADDIEYAQLKILSFINHLNSAFSIDSSQQLIGLVRIQSEVLERNYDNYGWNRIVDFLESDYAGNFVHFTDTKISSACEIVIDNDHDFFIENSCTNDDPEKWYLTQHEEVLPYGSRHFNSTGYERMARMYYLMIQDQIDQSEGS